MKLLVISDTHGDTQSMEKVIQHHQDVDTVIHCGDSELSASYFEGRAIHIVRGNCDFDEKYVDEDFFEIANEKILVVHGHKYNVKSTLMPLNYRAQEVHASIVCFGHSHILGAEVQNGILFINPGSLHMPRGRKEKSYAIVEKLENVWSVFFYTDEHKLMEQVRLNFL